MNLLQQTKYLIKKINLRPDKLKGQNFCISQAVLKQMVAAAEVSSTDNVLEAGAGFGFLTTELLARAKKVVAVEMEPALAKILRNLEGVHKNLEVAEGDILKISPLSFRATPSAVEGEPRNLLNIDEGFLHSSDVAFGKSESVGMTKISNYKIVANLPYGITSAFLKKFLTAEHQPTSMTLLLQKEVAERICATPGQISLLSVSVQLYGKPKIMEIVGRENFWPSPQVASAILKISDIHPYSFNREVPEKVFWQVIRSGFAGKRKQLHHNLQSSLHLTKEQTEQIFNQAGIDKKVRAQELSIENWLILAKNFVSLD